MFYKSLLPAVSFAALSAAAAFATCSAANAGGYGHSSGYHFSGQSFQGNASGYYDGYARDNPHLRWCYGRYRSYRDYDNTFQPYHGPRKACLSPFPEARLFLFPDQPNAGPEELFKNSARPVQGDAGRDKYGNLPEGPAPAEASAGTAETAASGNKRDELPGNAQRDPEAVPVPAPSPGASRDASPEIAPDATPDATLEASPDAPSVAPPKPSPETSPEQSPVAVAPEPETPLRETGESARKGIAASEDVATSPGDKPEVENGDVPEARSAEAKDDPDSPAEADPVSTGG